MSVYIAFRITLDTLDSEFLKWLTDNGTTLLVKENGLQCGIHFHGYAVANINGYRTRFKRALSGGNKVWSIKKCDDKNVTGYLRYICKGPEQGTMPTVILSEGHDTETLHYEYWTLNTQYKERANKKRKAENVLEDVWNDIKDELGFTVSGQQIASRIFRWYIDNNRRLPTGFAMQSMAMTYAARINDNYYGPEKLTDNEMISRLYPNINF